MALGSRTGSAIKTAGHLVAPRAAQRLAGRKFLLGGGHQLGRVVRRPGGVGHGALLEVDLGVAELQVADLGGRLPFGHERDWIRRRNRRGAGGAEEGRG